MELTLKKPIEEVVPQTINFNFEEIMTQLNAQLEHYKNLVYTEQQLPVAKADRAKLNNVKKSIDEWRKDIKKQYLKPFEEFEGQVKQIVALIDETNAKIDEQVKTFEDNKKNEKMAKIEIFYNDNVSALKDILPLEKIFKPEWLNVTFSLKKVQEDILATLTQVKNDLEVISSLKCGFEVQLKDYYLKSLDLTATLQEKTRFEENVKNLQEYAKSIQEQAKTDEEVLLLDFRVWATKTQIKALKEFLTQNNIKFGKVE